MTLTAKSAHRKDLRTTSASSVPMQHRHFAAIAGIIRDLEGVRLGSFTSTIADREAIARHFARHLKATNSNFDEDRFMAACMHNEED
jgi:hypothetical protein